MAYTSWSRIWTTMSRKPKKCSLQNMRWNWMQVILHADQRSQSKTTKTSSQKQYLLEKDFGPMLNHENIQSPIMQNRRNWFIFFVMNDYLEKMMERLNSGEAKTIFSIFPALSSLVWRQGEEKHGRRRRKQEHISVLYWFFRNNLAPPSSSRSLRTQSHWSYFTGQCRYSEQLLPIHLSCRMCNQFYIPSSIREWYLEVKFWATDRQFSFCLWIPMDRNHEDPDTIDLSAPRHAQYMHKAWKQHQNTVVCWVNIKHDRTLLFLPKHSQVIVFRWLLGWKLEKSRTRKNMSHLGLLPKISLKHDWMKELGSEVAQRPDGQVAIWKLPIEPTKSKPRSW